MAVEIQTNGGGANSFIAFLLGAVLIAVAVVAFFMWDNFKSHQGAPASPAAVHVTVKDK
jgi:hypothetical protein